jgi:hypothetical protein
MLYVSVPPFQHQNHLTDFYEIWYEYYATRGQLNAMYFVFYGQL